LIPLYLQTVRHGYPAIASPRGAQPVIRVDRRRRTPVNCWIPAGAPQLPGDALAVPAEGNFPVAVVAVHGLLAVSTLVLALLTVLGTSGR
jgi:hypothetical protein